MALTGNLAGWKGDIYMDTGATENPTVLLLSGNRWTLTWRVEDLDTTAFDDNGFRTLIPGIMSQDITIEGVWNSQNVAGAKLHATGAGALNIVPGMYASLKLFIDNAGGGDDFYRIVRAMCCDFTPDVDVHGVVKWTASFKSHGENFMSSALPGSAPDSSDIPTLSS